LTRRNPLGIRLNGSDLVNGYLGLYQFNVVVPNVAAGNTVPVTFSLNGTQGTQTVVIPIRN